MTTIPTTVVTPSFAADVYGRVDRGEMPSAAGGFGATLQRALESAVQTGHTADAKAMEAIAGGGNLTDVVTALAQAELTLQTTSAVRDRVVQAYQDIIRMPI
ncbi:MAG: flagellar hook-basal body complex protein FliE [Acetobacteraceae bacterium]